MKRALILCIAAACGEDVIVLPDAPPPVTQRCDPTAAFGTPTRITSLNTDKDDTAARLTPDELTVVFARRTGVGTGLFDLYTAARPTRDAEFAAPTLLATLNSVNSETWPSLSPDGLLIAFQSDRGATAGTYHVYTSKRASTADAFGPPTSSPALMDGDVHPYIASARAFYFTSAVRATGAGMADLWRAEIDSTGATSTPVNVSGVNTAMAEHVPIVSPDELTIYFRQTTAAGELDVYTATRASTTDPFGTPVAVPTLAQPAVNEVPAWISPDNCALYVELSDAPGGPGGDDLAVAVRGGGS